VNGLMNEVCPSSAVNLSDLKAFRGSLRKLVTVTQPSPHHQRRWSSVQTSALSNPHLTPTQK